MKFGKRDKSIVDALFLLALFGVFLISALFIVLFGAKIYKNTVKSSEDSFFERTCYTYITEKIRQNDNENCINISSVDGNTVISLTKNISGNDYSTYLYCDEGYLKEYTALSSSDFNRAAGTKIIELDAISAIECNPNLYRFTLSGADIETQFYVSISSNTGGVSNE